MLRLALIENIRRIVSRIALGLSDRKLAEFWAAKLIKTAEQQPANLILIVADMARSDPYLSNAFVAEFSRQLQGKSPSLNISLSWIEQRLSEHGQTVDERVHLEAQQQAGNQVSIGNSIASLRVLGAIDWREFVEGLSIVEKTLRQDPAGVYAAMDFATRDRYRHEVENISKRSDSSEDDVARHALHLAKESCEREGASHRSAHVGYFLSNKGLPALEEITRARVPMRQRLRRVIHRFPLMAYVGLIFILSAAATIGLPHLCLANINSGVQTLGLWALAALVIVATSQLAVALVNWFASLTMAPRTLPRMDYSRGIPADYPSMVVVPTMLSGESGITNLLELRLEVHYLSNRDDRLSFALLTDFRDAPQETMPEDAVALQTAVAGIQRLNQRYGSADKQPLLFVSSPAALEQIRGKMDRVRTQKPRQAGGNSMPCCAAGRRTGFRPLKATPKYTALPYATSSRWTRIQSCRNGMRRGKSGSPPFLIL